MSQSTDAQGAEILEAPRVEQALRESEARLRSVINGAPIVLWALDRDGVFTFSEGRGLQSLGLKAGEVVGRSVYEVYRDVPEVLEVVRRALAGEEVTSTVEFAGIAFESRYSVLRDERGAVAGVIGVATDVTERKRAEAELEHSLSVLRATLESTADGILVVDSAGRIVSSNRKFAEMWGIPQSVLDSGDDDQAIAAVLEQLKDPEGFVEKVRALYATPDAESYDALEFRDGRVLERFSQPHRIGSQVVGRVWSFRDVTERRRAEAALRAREAQLEATQALAGLGSWQWDVATDTVTWSRELYRIYGLEPQEFGASFPAYLERVHPDDRAAVRGHLERAMRTGSAFEFEERIVRPDGSVRVLRSIGEPTLDDEGRPVRLVGACRDVTEQKQAEEALRRSEERTRQILETAHEAFVAIGSDGRVIRWNSQAERTFGWSREEAMGRVLSELIIPAQYREAHEHGVRRFLATGEGPLVNHRIETIALHRDGREFPVELSVSAVREGDGYIFSSFLHDISERKEAQEALRRAYDELELRVQERTAELAETNMALEEEIAERERAEDELRRKSSELEAIFQALPDLYFRLNGEGRVVDCKAGKNASFLIPPERLLGRVVQEIVPPDEAPHFLQGLEEVRRSGELVCIEYSMAGDGGTRDFEARLLPFLEEETVIVVRDVTDQKEAERALRRSEEHFRFLVESSSDITTILDAAGRNRYQSPSIAALGYTPEEMAGTSAFERIHPDDAPVARQALLAVVREPGTTHSVEFRYRHKNGSWRVLEARARTLLPDSAAEGVIVSSRDVTERKSFEEELQRNEERLRSLIENGYDMIQVVSAEGAITYTSPSVERLLGYTPEEIEGHPPTDYIHPDDINRIRATMGEIFSVPGVARSEEYRIRHKNGTWRVFEAYGRTLLPDSPAEGMVVNARDVTERRHFEEVLRQAKEEAERANRAKSEFLSRMSHELRTPMNSILGFAQLLAKKELSEGERRAVDHILKAGRHLLNLINEVLDIARIESNRQPFSLEPVDVTAAVQEALSLIRPLAEQWGCTVNATLGCEGHVRADRQRLTQVLLNLLSNAVKYNRPGGSVRVTCVRLADEESGEERMRIGVHDTGPGIPPERRDELFVPFSRLGADQSDVEGTGLGLALSLRLVEGMGGRLFVESEVGEGSTFWVELERVDSPLERLARAGRPAPEGLEPRPSARPATVLYIEDNLANLTLVETILATRPEITLVPALQGRMGLDLACEHAPDLILLDLHLPDLPGAEVLRRLREQPRTRETPIVVISADAVPGTIQRLTEAGAQAYLTKPLDIDQFLETVDALLAKRKG